jgi:Ca2+-binding RTX toxin-like protein
MSSTSKSMKNFLHPDSLYSDKVPIIFYDDVDFHQILSSSQKSTFLDNLSVDIRSDHLRKKSGRDTPINRHNTLVFGQANIFQGTSRNDTYRVDHPRDRIRERRRGGIDTVRSVVNWTLPRNLENLTLRGRKAIRGTGNQQDNKIIGNRGNNILLGKNGDDHLKGKAGSDRLKGGKGSDILMGASRAAHSRNTIDVMKGGQGADTFVLGKRGSVFYDDKQSQTAGLKDYALIRNFNISEDMLRIGGNWSNYLFTVAPPSLPAGVAVYLKKASDAPHELIAIVQGTTVAELTARYQSTSPQLPSDNPPLQTQASYVNAANGIIANLDTGQVLLPIFGTQESPTIMPMGDSITAGVHTVDPIPGAYRIQLWDQLAKNNLTVDFVGSQSNGLENGLPDEDHEGYSGQRISFFTNLVNAGVFTTNPTDILLLMAGANDANADPALGITDVVDSMFQRLSTLLQRIQSLSPNTKVLLSSITPRDPSNTDSVKVQRVEEFNARLPGFIDNQVTLGRNVMFVDAGGNLEVSDLNSDGLHPSQDGYNKLGNAWYNALVEQEQVSGISNLIGSAFNDEIIGSRRSNTLDGRSGDDLLAGTTSVMAGANEQDVLIGGAGSDRFILGDASQPYYTANRDDDYVVIQDFDASEDVVQLHGVASDYVQQQVGGDRYLRLAGSNELIAIFSNTSNLVLTDTSVEFV